MKLQKIKTWLKKEGLKYKEVTLNTYNGESVGLMINNDYIGPYPSSVQFEVLNKVEKIIKKTYGEEFLVEPRGFYSGILIRKK